MGFAITMIKTSTLLLDLHFLFYLILVANKPFNIMKQYATELCIFFYICTALVNVLYEGWSEEDKASHMLSQQPRQQVVTLVYGKLSFSFFWLQACSSNIRLKVMLLGIYIRNFCVSKRMSVQKY